MRIKASEHLVYSLVREQAPCHSGVSLGIVGHGETDDSKVHEVRHIVDHEDTAETNSGASSITKTQA